MPQVDGIRTQPNPYQGWPSQELREFGSWVHEHCDDHNARNIERQKPAAIDKRIKLIDPKKEPTDNY
jgi:hypothetical protein